MPNVSDLFNFSSLSDRKQFIIVVVAIVLYFGYRDHSRQNEHSEISNQWKELYNKQTEKYEYISRKYDARLEKDIQKAENSKRFRDSVKLILTEIKSKKDSK